MKLSKKQLKFIKTIIQNKSTRQLNEDIILLYNYPLNENIKNQCKRFSQKSLKKLNPFFFDKGINYIMVAKKPFLLHEINRIFYKNIIFDKTRWNFINNAKQIILNIFNTKMFIYNLLIQKCIKTN